MKALIIFINILFILSACSYKKSNNASLRLIVERQTSNQKTVWGETTANVSEINCIGVFVSYPPEEIGAEGICNDASGSIVTTPAVAAGTIPFNYNQQTVLNINLVAGDNRKIELIGFETHLPACPPFFGIDDYMQLNSAPLMVLDTKVQNIPAGSSEISLNGIFANKKILDKCDGKIFEWPALPANNGIIIGGIFSQVNGQNQPGLAQLGLHDGSLLPTISATTPGTINTMDYDPVRQILYVGGNFTDIKNYLAAIDMVTGEVIPTFNPEPNNPVHSIKLFEGGNKLIVGGEHSSIGGGSRPYLAIVDTSLGNLDVTFNATVTNVVRTVHVDEGQGKIFIGGTFTSVGGQGRGYAAAVNLANGNLITSFTPTFNNTVYAIVAPPGAGVVYFGGDFTTLDSSPSGRLAQVDGVLGNAIPTFDATDSAVNGTVFSLVLDSLTSTLFIGGHFNTVGGITRNNVAAVDSIYGNLKPFNPNVLASPLGVKSMAIKKDIGIIYLGGDITSIGSAGNVSSRAGVAAVFMDDGEVLDLFNANLNLSGGSVNSILIP